MRPHPPSVKSPAECSARGCCLHSGTHGCRVVEGLPASEVGAVLEPHGGFGQTACPLVELLLRCLHKALPIASVGDALSELFLLLKKISRRVQARVNVSYLVRSARHWTVDRKRQEGVRPRCGSCQHYGWMARTCLHQGNPHVGLLISPSMNPADLQPPCEWFRSRKETLGAGDAALDESCHDRARPARCRTRSPAQHRCRRGSTAGAGFLRGIRSAISHV
ncbi:MAG: hypothetical protein U1E76_27335 [Planctomycetota bacterium]